MLSRRAFNKLVAGTGSLMKIGNALSLRDVFASGSPSRIGADVYLKQQGNSLRFGNSYVELLLDSATGYFQGLLNKQTGVQHLPGGEGVWPFGIWVGTRKEPQAQNAEVRSDGVQRMTWRVEAGERGTKRLVLTYPMLVENTTEKATGVGMGVTIELAPDREYFVIRAEIANGGPEWVTNFYAGHGEVLTGDAARTTETIWMPTRGGFKRNDFRGFSLGHPTYTWGWSDYSGKHGGVGMGYVNQQGIQMMFDLKPTAGGLLQGWHLFDTRGYWHFENLMNDFQKSLRIQPLEPGNNFKTDEWLIVLHKGDWHRTADAYQERYLEVFKDDYMSWAKLPDRVKKEYIRTGVFVAENSIGNTFPRKVLNPLKSVPPQVETVVKNTGADPGRVSTSLTFFQPHVGRYPEWFPVWGPAGGEEGLKNTVDELHRMGLAYVTGYTHLSYDHPAAKDYVLEADVLDTVPSINPTAGNRACVDNSAWTRKWREELIPAYKAHGLDGVYADEGHFPWGMCAVPRAEHLHGTSAVGILTANTRGILLLHKLLHEGMGPDSVIMVEGAGEIGGRWVDANHAYPDPAVAYTLPFKRYYWGLDVQTPELHLLEHVNIALAYGYVIMFNLRHDKPVVDFGPLRHYVEMRKQLDAARAPGYPQGFKDTIGVKTSSPSVAAKVFVGTEGITVLHYSTASVESAKVSVDGSALGHPHIGIKEYMVVLDTNGIGFQIFRG